MLYRTEVVEETLAALNRDTGALQESCEVAAALCDLNDKPLTAKERWRMPLVIGKVDRGQRLNAKDTRIFGRVQFNMQTDQDLAAMNNVMNRTTAISTSNSTTVSTATTPRSRSLTPSSSRMYLDTTSRTPRASTLLSDTACSRNKNMREEATTHRVIACKSRKSKNAAGTPRHKKSTKSPKTRSVSQIPKSSYSLRSHTTSSDGFETSFCEVGVLEEETEGVKEISSAVTFVLSGLQAFGSSIKASFNFGSGSTKGECSSTNATDVVVKGEERTMHCTSPTSSRSVRTIRVFKKDSVVADTEQRQGSLASMAAAAADAVNSLTLSEQSAFVAALPDIKEHEGECMELGAVDSLKKPVHKAVRRNSLLGSFVQLFTGKAVPLSEGRDTDGSDSGDETHNKTPLQSGLYVPVVSKLLSWGTSTGNKKNQVLPAE